MEDLRSLEDLLDLQAVDSEIDRLLHRRQSLPELVEYRGAHERVAGLDARLAAVAVGLRDSERAIDKAEGELEIAETKLNQEERRLFAGGLSARDTEHLRREVEMLRRQISDREDEVLSLIEAKEAADGEQAMLAEERAAAAAVEAELEGVIATAWRSIDADIARAEERKGAIVPLIPNELLELYESLRPIKQGVAAGRLADGTCGGCHLRLSSAEQVAVLKEDPPRCLHCRRILVP